MRPAPPMSNNERQRRFRASHPGYFNKYNGRRKAMRKAAKEKNRAMMAALAAAEAEKARAAAAIPAMSLMLPAPAEIPIIPGMNTIGVTPAQEPLTISLPKTIPVNRSIAA
jgi:hypothetical protein